MPVLISSTVQKGVEVPLVSQCDDVPSVTVLIHSYICCVAQQGSFTLYVRVRDRDSSFSEGYSDDNVDEFSITRTMSPGSNSGELRFTGTTGKTLKLRFEVDCNPNYYGSSCTTHCVAQDNNGGHFTCGSNGQKICIEGWSDPSNQCLTGELLYIQQNVYTIQNRVSVYMWFFNCMVLCESGPSICLVYT